MGTTFCVQRRSTCIDILTDSASITREIERLLFEMHCDLNLFLLVRPGQITSLAREPNDLASQITEFRLPLRLKLDISVVWPWAVVLTRIDDFVNRFDLFAHTIATYDGDRFVRKGAGLFRAQRCGLDFRDLSIGASSECDEGEHS